MVPSDAQIEAYFVNPMALSLMLQTTVQLGGIQMNLCNLCPIPLVWAPCFLNSKMPYDVLQMGRALVATLETVGWHTQA